MSDKMREEFETWAVTSAWLGIGDESQMHQDAEGSGYNEIEVHTAWLAWKASRESLVIELPPVRPEPSSSGDALQSDGEAATWNIWVGDKLALLAECYGMLGKLGAESEAMRKTATELRRWAQCSNLHHEKADRHEFDEPCKVLARIDKALSKEG